MISILENKVEKKLLQIANKKGKLSNRLTKNLELEIEINELLDAYDDIEKSKKDMFLYIILSAVSILLISIHSIFIIGSIYMAVAAFIEKSNIKENKQLIANSEYKFDKSRENLEEQIIKNDLKRQEIKKLISSEKKKMEKYKKIQEEIQYVKDIQNNVNDENFKILKDLYSEVPLLAFDSKDEYKNYLSYDNEFIKEELINSKILTKKHK